jgi:threonine dehydrogenase-like Zn-dependent dehydrogenase
MTQAASTVPCAAPTRLMQAAVITAPRELTLRQVPLPQPGPHQIRVKLQGCGVCASNIPPWEGRPWFSYPMAPGQLGHEAWGLVDAVGDDVTNMHPGDRVAMISDHAYAEFDLTTPDRTVRLPEPLREVPFPAEPLGCAMNIFRRSGIRPGDTVAILGVGFLGALLTRLAQDAGARVLAVSRRTFSLEIARAMGASESIAMDDHSKVIERVRELTSGQFCDVVIECVGKQWPLDLAGELTHERGRLVVAGYHQDGPRQVNMQLWNWRGLDVINAHEREPEVYLAGMLDAVEAVTRGRIDPVPLFTHSFRLDQLAEALEMTSQRPDGFMKALIRM